MGGEGRGRTARVLAMIHRESVGSGRSATWYHPFPSSNGDAGVGWRAKAEKDAVGKKSGEREMMPYGRKGGGGAAGAGRGRKRWWSV